MREHLQAYLDRTECDLDRFERAIVAVKISLDAGLNILSYKCPTCCNQHLDEGTFATRPHKHTCVKYVRDSGEYLVEQSQTPWLV